MKSLKVDKLLITHQLFNLSTFKQKQAKLAFTMAEILLSLTIIGVVAAITLPSLTGNINERTWNTQRKALYSRISQAIALMPALNNYGTLDATTDNATETFITSGLAKVLKINNICSQDNLEDCGIVTTYTNIAANKRTMPKTLHGLNGSFANASYDGKSYSTQNTKAAAFETANGENIIVFYNRSCKTQNFTEVSASRTFGFPEATMCVNFIYDLNGKKGPNTVGKDIGFITVFNATDSKVVAPMPASPRNANSNNDTDWETASAACTTEDPESRLPNLQELSAMLINDSIVELTSGVGFWSGSVFDADHAWAVDTVVHMSTVYDKGGSSYVRCVKR